MDIALAVLVHAVAFLIVGLPVALAIRSRTDGWGALVTDALVNGLVVTVTTIVFADWLGVAGVVLGVAAWIAALVVAIVRRAGLPAFSLPRGRGWILPLAWVALVALTLWLRWRSVNFLPWVGDMGAYVNWANEFARTGELHSTWPPFFSSFLAISSFLFGPAATTAAVPLTGLLLVLAVARVLRQFDVGPWVAFTTSAFLAINVHAIWFSTFPGSEALNAPIFVAWAGSLIAIARAQGLQLWAWVGVNALLSLALGLIRGTGPLLLVPLIATAIVATSVRDWRPIATRVWLAFTAGVAGALVSYWYGIQVIPKYYVFTQIADYVPKPVFKLLEKLGLFSPTLVTAVVLLVVSAAICAAGLLIARRRSRVSGESRVPFRLGVILASAITAGLIVDLVVNTDMWHVLVRVGLWVVIAAIATLAVIGRARRGDTVLYVLFLGTTMAIFLALHTYRLKLERGHSFFLYWDRYVFSELVPLFFLIAGVGGAVLWAWLAPKWATLRASGDRLVRAFPVVVAGLLVAVLVIPTIPRIQLVTQDTYMRGAYEFTTELIELVPDDMPVAWSSTLTGPYEGFFFPNTWMAFARPMIKTFGVNVVNDTRTGTDFSDDVVYTDDTLIHDTVCEGDDNQLVVLELDAGGATLPGRISDPSVEIEPLGTVSGELSLLGQPARDGWTQAQFTVNGWLVTVDDERAAQEVCDA